jgi:5-methylthioadenosine/S-adenosylhomocysteine deaminase
VKDAGGPPARTLYRGGYILTLDAADTVFERGDLLVEDTRIAAVGPEGSVDASRADRVVPSEHLLFLPGMVNAHTHSNATWVKGRYPGRPLELWRQYPRSSNRVLDDEGRYLAAMLAHLEQLRTGTTTTIDHFIIDPQAEHFGAPSVVRAIRDSGIRGVIACNISDVPYEETVPIGDGLSADARVEVARVTAAEAHSIAHGTAAARTILEAAEAFVRALHDPAARVICQLGPSAPQRCTDRLLTGVRALADRLGVGIHIHVLESKTQGLVTQQRYGTTAIAHLERIGFLGPFVTLAHCVWVPDQDFERIARAGATVAHNPTSNLQLGSGVAPIRAMLAAGVNVALGTDSAASNDTLNMFEACRLASILHNHHTADFRTWPTPAQVLRMATVHGARALGPGATVGTLEVGKAADFVGLNRRRYPLVPLNEPQLQIVYCETGASVDTVVIDGRTVLEGGRILTFDEAVLLAEVAERHRRTASRFAAEDAATARLEPALVRMIDQTRPVSAVQILGHARPGM